MPNVVPELIHSLLSHRSLEWISWTHNTCQDFQAFSPEDSDDLNCEITIKQTTVKYIKLCFISKYKVAFQNSYIKLKLQCLKELPSKSYVRTNQFSDRKVADIFFVCLLFRITRLCEATWGLPHAFWSRESESEPSSKEVSNTQISRANKRKMDSADDDLLRSYEKIIKISSQTRSISQWLNASI